MDPNRLVWFPDSRQGYAIGRLVDISRDHVSVQPVARPSSTSSRFELVPAEEAASEFPYKSVYPADQLDLKRLDGPRNPEEAPDVEDNCALIQLNEAALLENVRLRFHRDKIYTYVAHILIAVNPYFEIRGLHSPEAIASYQGKSLGTMPPHVYAIADKAYRDMKAFKQSQSIIINGESGAGKTESQKYVLRYLCLSGSQSGRLEKLILDANPLLEAFGNAKTIRNNNSSRFGKFIEIHYNGKFVVSGGLFFHYLLEKSRICTQSSGERNYHIFYQLCACLPQQQWLALELGPPDQFHYLRSGCTQYFCSRQGDADSLAKERKSRLHLERGAIQDQLIDDLKCYEETERALENFGVGEEQKGQIYKIVASVLHLGNISFCDDQEDRGGGCRIEPGAGERALETTARLMGLDKDLLRQSLVSRIMSTTRGGHKGTVYMVQLSVQQAQAARDALAKAIYSKLFDHIVTRIVNRSIPFTSSSYYIGVLDVAGFEYFQRNDFEQFLINFCNEKLQQFFNERILKEEQTIYEKEGLQLKRVEFVDNQDCLQLLEAKSTGIFDLLDEESRLPKPSAQHFAQSVHAHNKGHFRLAVPRTSKLKSHREIRDDEGFLIRHFAGAVCYQTQSFIDKNNDALHASLKNLMLDAQHELLRNLFTDPQQPSASTTGGAVLVRESAPSASAASNKLNFISVGTTFRSQLQSLMAKLRSTGSHFIRCIKPNGDMVAHKFEGGQILSQLHCSGMDSVLELMQQGYPSRSSFNDLYLAYKRLLPDHLARLDSHLFCRALFKALGLQDGDFRFGSSKVFFRPGKFAEFDQIIRSDSEHVAELVGKVSRWLLCSRWRKAQYCCLSVIKLHRKILYRRQLIIGLQKNWRQALVARRLRFRLEALRRARQVAQSLRDFEQIAVGELGSGSRLEEERRTIEEQTGLLKTEVEQFIQELQTEVRELVGDHAGLKKEDLEERRARCQAQTERLITKRDLLVRSIKDKLAKQRELEQLEQRMVAERAKRAQEEEARRREQLVKRQRAELEQRRQEELRANTSSSDKPLLVDSGTMTSEIHADQDQERRDYEIALRLAQEGAPSSLEAARQSAAASQPFRPHPVAPSQLGSGTGGKLDLTRWKYSDLRDTINTSCDLELLEACKREFHRRLKVYHAWRAMNSSPRQASASSSSDGLRAPQSVLRDASQSAQNQPSDESSRQQINEQRYFRIPFVKSSAAAAASGGQRGWWFAHFDGQWIARQLELHPDKEPILLVAGRDDIEMCELSLSETRLTSKRGAEILPQEFEEEWTRHGGGPYARGTGVGVGANNSNNNSTASRAYAAPTAKT